MAREAKKDPSELTVEEKLKALYQLQTMLSEIDKIKTLRGELPLEVQDLEDEVAGLSTRIEKIKADIEELKSNIATKKIEIETAKTSVEKYKAQQDNVRNNREYDVLTKEIEFQSLEIELCEKRIKEYIAAEKAKSEEIEHSNQDLDERKKDLEAKKSELEEIVSETKQEEEKLREKAKVLETTIEPRLLQAFKRIRKNSRNGLGIVYVQRDACGGCFNKIPPQKQLDIRMRKKIIVCEYCGRIMIDPELAGVIAEQHLETVKEMKEYIESAGLRWSVVESLPVCEAIKYAGPDRDRLITNYIQSLTNLGKAGIKTVCYNFMPVIDWIRTDLNHPWPDKVSVLRRWTKRVRPANLRASPRVSLCTPALSEPAQNVSPLCGLSTASRIQAISSSQVTIRGSPSI